MVVNIALVVIFLIVAGLLGWLAWRLWHSRHVLARWAGGILASLFTLTFAAVGIFGLLGIVKFLAPPSTAVPDLKVAGTQQQVERGHYIVNSLCVECHSVGRQLPLSGGADMADRIPIPVGSLTPPNLTPAGPLQNWSDGQIWRALKTGVDAKGHHLIVMSTVPVRYLSDEDTQAVIAYLRSQPAIENKTPDPPDQPSFLAAVLFGAGMLPQGLPPVPSSISAPPMGPTAEYGQYIVDYSGCRDCHGENLTGGDPNSMSPHGPSLRVVKGWTAEQFITTLRTGVKPDGTALTDQMPWRVLGRLNDNDLTAVYQYLVTLQ